MIFIKIKNISKSLCTEYAVQVLGTSVPRINVLEINVLEINVPRINVLEINVPRISVLEINVLDINDNDSRESMHQYNLRLQKFII